MSSFLPNCSKPDRICRPLVWYSCQRLRQLNDVYSARRGIQGCKLAWLALLLSVLFSGCSLLPDIKHKPQYINPFPQLKRVAVLPFVNQSEEPTLSAERVTLAYINELQSIPGFEVLPYGVVNARLQEYDRPLASGEDFQALARDLDVDVVLLGSVTDYSAYYPPRLSLKVNWYAANPAFHPILPGYGLPWGTKDEKKIPRWVHQEAQRALAAEQMQTQIPDPLVSAAQIPLTNASPDYPISKLPSAALNESAAPNNSSNPTPPIPKSGLLPEDGSPPAPEGEALPADDFGSKSASNASSESQSVRPVSHTASLPPDAGMSVAVGSSLATPLDLSTGQALPPGWPDARGFNPAAPSISRPPMLAQHEPIISHMRNYNGHDEDFTQRVSEYFYFRDDARFGGWQAYLQRSEDFLRVCCHFHITETLACRGGEDESRLIFRWPIDRYQR